MVGLVFPINRYDLLVPQLLQAVFDRMIPRGAFPSFAF